MTAPPDPLAVARSLTESMDGLSQRLEEVREDSEGRDTDLARYGRRNRRMVWLSLVSIALDVTLTILLVFTFGTAHNSQVQANAARAVTAAQHQSLLYACQLGNQSRRQQIQLWSHLAAISTNPPHLTRRQIAENKRKIQQLLDYIKADFRPRNCSKIYHLPGGRP